MLRFQRRSPRTPSHKESYTVWRGKDYVGDVDFPLDGPATFRGDEVDYETLKNILRFMELNSQK